MKKLMRQDLTGKRFSKLTALHVDDARSKNGKVFWICKCDCGNVKSVQSTALTRKNGTKSCGCARNSEEAKAKKEITQSKYPSDITGMTFGRLTVIRKTNTKSNRVADNGGYLWECKCECGNLCYYSRYSLITPNGVKSCGCLYTDSRFEIAKKYCEYDLDTYDFGIGYCNNSTHFFFDKEDYDKIKEYAWWYDGKYVCAHSLHKDKYTTAIIRLHRVVMDIGDREDINVDHKNHVRYDCRKTNLRKANDFENAWNVDRSKYSSTGVAGVKLQSGKYVAIIGVNGETIRLGSFDTLEEACEARIEAEVKYFSEFRYCLEDKDIIDETNLESRKIFKSCG